MKQQNKWQADLISLTLVYGDSFPISLAHVKVKSGKEAERSLSVALPHAIPLVKIRSARGLPIKPILGEVQLHWCGIPWLRFFSFCRGRI